MWSKHVDVNPGDRAGKCGGMMRPVAIDFEKGSYILIHRCEECGEIKRNHVAPEDDFDKVIEVKAEENKRMTGA